MVGRQGQEGAPGVDGVPGKDGVPGVLVSINCNLVPSTANTAGAAKLKGSTGQMIFQFPCTQSGDSSHITAHRGSSCLCMSRSVNEVGFVT